jgi:hypothetical protein
LRDAIKKSLALFNSIDLKPPEKKSVKSVRKSEDYRTMEGLMIQRLEQRIKRAMKKMRQQAR